MQAIGREVELVIVSPGIEEAPSDDTLRDPLKHHMFWGGTHWVVEYPDALTWGGNDPYEEYLVEDTPFEYDEDAYEAYLEDEYNAAEEELLDCPEIPIGSYIEEGCGYGQRCLATKRSMK